MFTMSLVECHMTSALTPVTYSPTEAREIRTKFQRGDAVVRCPRCREPLTFGLPVIERGRHLYAEIYCETCQHVLMLRIADEIR
jgi:hypothetical protein